MNRSIKKLIPVILAAVILYVLSATGFAADLGDPEGGIAGIANKGLWTRYPENSLEGILAAEETGIDYVLADVSVTGDGKLVLMESASAKRMLGTEKENVSDYSLDELSSLPLKNRVGGNGNDATNYHICTLAEALAAVKDAKLVLKFDASLADKVAKETENSLGTVFYITGKTGDALWAAEKYGKEHAVLAEKKSNIIFSVTSFIKKMSDAGAKGAVLKTGNRYGVVFYKSTIKKCGSLRAVADTSDYKTAGYREDAEKWWDDLVSRGYSAVITDDPEAFAEYRKQNDAARERLQGLYEEVKKMNIPDFGADVLSDYKKAYADAVNEAERLLGDKSSSLKEMRDCHTALTQAVKYIQLNFDEIENGTAGVTLTAPRIIICVLAAAVVILVQVYFYKRRKS
ncbi:MAG: hypothetical protein IJS90_08175 [Clostridia bacterium]|nr:hypothetical protein [Clostridia bacterium]